MSNEDEIVKEALRLIDQGWKHLLSQSTSNPKRNVIFVLGGTGAGKSTTTEIITGDLSKLYSILSHKGTGLVITDTVSKGEKEGRIGDPQISSKTFLPEYLVCSDDSTLVFIDCPGFNDNRGTHMDIAAMVLIKKIAEQVDYVRFVFVTPFSSVSYSNLQRNDFLQLCGHATSFIKNLEKVENSMGLVVTKVNNFDFASGLEMDEEVAKSEITQFLEEVAQQSSISAEDKHFVKCLLRDNSKWALIRYPIQKGPLSEIKHFSDVRQQILEICRDKLECASVDREDFAVTISADSKYIIRKRLIPYMKEEINRIVTELVKVMETGYMETVTGLLKTQEISNLVICVKKLRGNCENLKRQEMEIANNQGSLASKRVIEVAQWLEIMLPEGKQLELKEIENKSKLFGEITDEVDNEAGGSIQINSAFANLRSQLDELYKTTLKSVREEIHSKIQGTMESLTDSLQHLFFQSNFYSGLNVSTLEAKRQVLANAHCKLQQLKGRFSCIFAWIQEVFQIFGKQIPEAEKTYLDEYKQILDLYDENLGSPAARPMDRWIESLRALEEKIADLDKLYEFLVVSKNADSSTFTDFNVNGICDDGIISNFLNAFKANSEISTIAQQKAGSGDKVLICELARYAISGRTKMIYSGSDKVIVKGRHVKFSEFVNEDGIPARKNVVVLAAETLELDRNINGRGKELIVTVIGDKWIVKGAQRTIQLGGNDAQPVTEKKAQSGRNYGESGWDGKEGASGENGGSFFGVYRVIENGSSLSIYSNGGNGADGQDGGDGYVGKDAEERPVQLKNPIYYLHPVAFVTGAIVDIVGACSEQPKGGTGGRGGDGGNAGYPGAAGVVKLIGVCGGYGIGSLCSSHGNPGTPGKAGCGGGAGKGGSSGNSGNNGSRRDSPRSTNPTCLEGCDVQEFRNYITQEIFGSVIGNEFLRLINNSSEIPRG